MKPALLCLVVGVLLSPDRAAADITVNASLDRETAVVGEQVTLTVAVSGSFRGGGEPELPDLPDFEVYGAGRSQNISLVNGSLSTSITHTYVLIPKRAGTFEIGPIMVEKDGTEYRSRKLTLQVAPPSPQARGRAPGTGQPSVPPSDEDRSGTDRSSDNMFLTTSVDRRRAYVNQEIILSIKFYRRVNPVETPEYIPPATTGFWVEDLPPQRSFYEKVNGKDYLVTEIQTALFPTTPGEHTIGAANLRCQIRGSRDPFGGDPFDLLRRGVFDDLLGRLQTITIHSDPITVEALPLPDEGKPADFGGAVGDYTMEAALDPDEVPAGEPVTMRVVIRGDGNIKTIPDPIFPPFSGLRVYDSGSSLSVSKEDYHVGGEKVLEKVLVPTAQGRYVIPPASLSLFDPQSGYRTISTDTLYLKVGPATTPAASAAGYGSPREVELRQRDIRYLRANLGSLLPKSPAGLPAGSVLWIQLLPLFALGVACGWQYQIRRRERDPGYLRYRRAGGEAKRRLAEAKKLARQGESAECSSAVSRALVRFVADRLELESAMLTPAEAAAALRARGVTEELAARLRSSLERCDQTRFAPGEQGRELTGELLQEAEGVLRDLARTRIARRPSSAGVRS